MFYAPSILFSYENQRSQICTGMVFGPTPTHTHTLKAWTCPHPLPSIFCPSPLIYPLHRFPTSPIPVCTLKHAVRVFQQMHSSDWCTRVDQTWDERGRNRAIDTAIKFTPINFSFCCITCVQLRSVRCRSDAVFLRLSASDDRVRTVNEWPLFVGNLTNSGHAFSRYTFNTNNLS